MSYERYEEWIDTLPESLDDGSDYDDGGERYLGDPDVDEVYPRG